MSLEKMRRTVQVILDALGNRDAELSILIVDDEQIAELNRTYLQREGPTNVIAFPMNAGEFAKLNPHLIGDVVISVETARKEACSADMSFDDRFDELLIHGILHLFGYDHETDQRQAEVMARKSLQLKKLL